MHVSKYGRDLINIIDMINKIHSQYCHKDHTHAQPTCCPATRLNSISFLCASCVFPPSPYMAVVIYVLEHKSKLNNPRMEEDLGYGLEFVLI